MFHPRCAPVARAYSFSNGMNRMLPLNRVSNRNFALYLIAIVTARRPQNQTRVKLLPLPWHLLISEDYCFKVFSRKEMYRNKCFGMMGKGRGEPDGFWNEISDANCRLNAIYHQSGFIQYCAVIGAATANRKAHQQRAVFLPVSAPTRAKPKQTNRQTLAHVTNFSQNSSASSKIRIDTQTMTSQSAILESNSLKHFPKPNGW